MQINWNIKQAQSIEPPNKFRRCIVCAPAENQIVKQAEKQILIQDTKSVLKT